MLRGISADEFRSVLAWAPLFKESLAKQRSLVSLLLLVQQSQQQLSRSLWYQTCFFFASLSKISERAFLQLFFKRWSFSFFFCLVNQSFFFRSLEYYFNEVDYLKFSPKYFRGTSIKITKNLLPYKNFHLRAPSSLFLVLWYHSEQVRMRFFNDYVKSHDYINDSRHLSRRFRFQKTIFSYRVRGCRKILLRYFFLFYARAQRYRVLEFQGKALDNELASFSFSSTMFPTLYQSNSFQLALSTKKFSIEPLAAIRQRFLIGINFLQMNLWSNTLLAQDPLSFGHMVRMDWTHFLASFPIFVLSFRLRPWLHIWTNRLIKKFCTLVFKEYRRGPFDFFLLSALRHSFLPLQSSYRLYFTWWVLKFRINRYWNCWVLDKWARVSVFYNTRTAAKMFPLNYQILTYIRLFRSFLFKFAVYGDLKYVSPVFTKTMFPLDFLFWRMSSSNQMYRDFFLAGAYSLSTVYRKLTLDHYAVQRQVTFRVSLETLMLRFGFFMCAGFTWQGQQNNPWCLTPPYKRLPDGVYHPNEPRWSFTNHILILAVRRFILSVFRRSRILSLFAFFLIRDDFVVYPSRFLFFFTEIVSTFVAYKRTYSFYRNTHLKQFRRYPHKVFVHSRVDPSFRVRWFSFADRMRRAGIKRSDLPYYPVSDDTDIVADLTARNSKFLWSKVSRYWIINPLI